MHGLIADNTRCVCADSSLFSFSLFRNATLPLPLLLTLTLLFAILAQRIEPVTRPGLDSVEVSVHATCSRAEVRTCLEG